MMLGIASSFKTSSEIVTHDFVIGAIDVGADGVAVAHVDSDVSHGVSRAQA